MTKNATSPRDKHKTEQIVGTDPHFIEAINRTHEISWDLACTEENCVADTINIKGHNFVKGFYLPKYDSLEQDWHDVLPGKWLWLNPPFNNIKPWAEKAFSESVLGAKILMLTPASVGSKWYAENVQGRASVRFLTGRLTFKGHKNPYPKDCMLSIFDRSWDGGITTWDWRNLPFV